MKQLTDNELIAEFMGDRDKVLCDPKWMKGDELVYLRYHLSWDWLMPVVQKIERVLSEYHSKDTSWLYWNNVFDGYVNTKIELTIASVVGFIRWHNTQNQTN